MNLFVRIFLFFWLTAALLAASFFVLGRLSGGQVIERNHEVLKAQAVTVSALWQQGRHRATQHWLFQLPGRDRPILLDALGRSPFPMHANANKDVIRKLNYPLDSAIQRHRHGYVSLIEAVPDIEPPLFLVRQLEPSQLHRMPIWLWLLAALLIISLISYLLAHFLSRRIRHLRHAVQSLSDGDLSSRVSLRGRDEVSELAADFNQMADRINDMLDSQRRLVSDVSHELRSPLARLRIALELAQRSDDRSTALPRIEKEANELESLVTELLSLARIESGQFQLEKQDTDIIELLQQIIHDANFEGEAKHCEVRLEAVEAVTLSVDPVLIRAAIENVVRNAIHYSPEHSVVQVSTQLNPEEFTIIVEDSGIGVPEQSLNLLFKPFTRVAEARDRSSGGFGLGLAITGKSLLAHGGKAIAENREQGGLRVILNLPM
ncbi:MAG: ATP-binding protein [Gammaproteobacteria bacterium]|nr:ATP-binding protein [Gammaproteobacteria bacterium]